MICRTVKFPDGHAAIVCSRREKPKRCKECGEIAPFLCDYPMSDKPIPVIGSMTMTTLKTCDRPMCEDHRERVGENRDYCLRHARLAKEKKAQGELL